MRLVPTFTDERYSDNRVNLRRFFWSFEPLVLDERLKVYILPEVLDEIIVSVWQFNTSNFKIKLTKEHNNWNF
jgi:hypothetical protein